jgi:RNA-directed DNA polymerase
MAVKRVIAPLGEADFLSCSSGGRPKRTPRKASQALGEAIQAGNPPGVAGDIRRAFDTLAQAHLPAVGQRRVTASRGRRLIRAGLRAGGLADGRVTQPVRGPAQGGVSSPRLTKMDVPEVDRQWGDSAAARLGRDADDLVSLGQTAAAAPAAWAPRHQPCEPLGLTGTGATRRLPPIEEGFPSRHGGPIGGCPNGPDAIVWVARSAIWKDWTARCRNKEVGKPDTGKRYVRFDEGGLKTGQ